MEIAKLNSVRFDMPNLPEIADNLTGLFSRLSAASSARRSKEAQLIDALEGGELIALGYPTDRPLRRKPEQVPPYLIQLGFADFKNSEFGDGQHRYAAVRIVDSNEFVPAKKGRPSSRDLVSDIANTLLSERMISREMAMKEQIRAVRKLGKFGDGPPYDQTIRRHLNSFWTNK